MASSNHPLTNITKQLTKLAADGHNLEDWLFKLKTILTVAKLKDSMDIKPAPDADVTNMLDSKSQWSTVALINSETLPDPSPAKEQQCCSSQESPSLCGNCTLH